MHPLLPPCQHRRRTAGRAVFHSHATALGVGNGEPVDVGVGVIVFKGRAVEFDIVAGVKTAVVLAVNVNVDFLAFVEHFDIARIDGVHIQSGGCQVRAFHPVDGVFFNKDLVPLVALG